MGVLSVAEALERSADFPHAVISFLDPEGYPISAAGDFTIDRRRNTVSIGPLSTGSLPHEGQEVSLAFSHVRPQEGIGYDQRRYVNAWGQASVSGSRVVVEVTDATGWDEKDMPFFEYAERSVPRGREYLEDLGAEPHLARGWLFFLATRLPFLTATIVPIALGAAVAALHGFFSWSRFGITIAAGAAVHLGLNIANDVFDDLSGADRAGVNPTPFSGGSRVIQYGLMSRRAMGAMSLTFYAVGIGLGVYLAETRGRWLYAIGAAGLLISLFYTAPPLRLVHRGLGEAAVALGFGPVMVLGSYFVMAQRITFEAFYVSLPVAFLIALVLYVNEVPDRAGDAAVGKRTLVVRWSKERVVAGFAAGAIITYLLIVAGAVLGITPVFTLVALLTTPMAFKIHKELGGRYGSPYELMATMQTNIGLHLFTGLLLLAGYIVAIII